MIARARATRVIVSVVACAIALPAAGYLFGPRGLAIAAALALLWLAWRHDNEVGVCLPLAVLFLIVIGVMGLLLYLMLITHQR
ncbi:apolipoprotein N-acyltransferase [Sphingomonas sp. F9_3S_D5_B_2]